MSMSEKESFLILIISRFFFASSKVTLDTGLEKLFLHKNFDIMLLVQCSFKNIPDINRSLWFSY